MENVSKVSSKTKYSIIGTAGLAFCGVLVETSMNVTFPTLMTQFHESLNNVQWVTTIYLLVVAITMTTTAFAQRRFSLRSLLTLAGLLFVLGILTSELARSLPILLVGRVIQGVSTGLTMPLMFAIIMMGLYSWAYSNFTHRQRLEQEQLTHEVNYDALTRAKSNTSYLNETPALFAKFQDAHQPLTFIELDLDNFKSINDRFSHLAGNGALTKSATTLTHTLQHSQRPFTFYRTGGEEFVIILPGTTLAAAIPIAKNCLDALRTANYHYDQAPIKITASFGVTELQPDDIVMNDLYSRADDSLYISKQHGRDCITVNGETLDVNQLSTTVVTSTFFAQPVMDIEHDRLMAQEILMRTFDHGHWLLPDISETGMTVQLSMISRFTHDMPGKSLAINLTAQQFANLYEMDHLIKFVRTHHLSQAFGIELVNIPSLEQVTTASELYHQAGILIFIDNDDIINDDAALTALLPYIDGIKLDLHRLPAQHQALIAHLQELTDAAGKDLILHGVSSHEDFQ
ncbi:hypothetical protein FC26_GL000327 [Paucilactobacillus vaccinostercus DSM 20634]|uniref:GGDEF domain-containing protein n=1 Tax=Paucilactobacillus vaccinostercus DSM 20634 TaxID=1423813 RepID=A0A0R2ADR2_9LACO|nr:MFS transporter [Paucilactobacillus vaccinostercus]KRM60844.1 hypothetical protein FC26_GL000327 [Paucilactobacillus vaccinostercus DSM 20634]